MKSDLQGDTLHVELAGDEQEARSARPRAARRGARDHVRAEDATGPRRSDPCSSSSSPRESRWFVAVTLAQPVVWLLLSGALFEKMVEIPDFHGGSY